MRKTRRVSRSRSCRPVPLNAGRARLPRAARPRGPRPSLAWRGDADLPSVRSFFTFQAESGGAFKGFKGLVASSSGGGFSGFGAGAGAKPLEGLSNGTGAAGAAAESKAAFGKPGPRPPHTGPR